MQSEAVFENIAERIIKEIKDAKQSIYIAVAWFTNKSIFDNLLLKAKQGCIIQIIISNDEINNNSSIDYELLEKQNGRLYKIGNGTNELMHNKFCVIDYNSVITGSYNWSYKAENNFENIVINSNDTVLAEQFVNEFNQIKSKYFPAEEKTVNDFPLDKIIKRLEIILNYFVLEDIKDVKNATLKLIDYQFNKDIYNIITAINSQEYSTAIADIQKFINTHQQLSLWNDPEIAGLNLEIKLLESQINAFDNEKIEIEKKIFEFQHQHTLILGELILELLKLRKLKYKNHQKETEAEEDYRKYHQQFEVEKDKHQFQLNQDERLELKKNFRKASILCHPDKVSDEYKKEAEATFIALKKAYEENDVIKVNQILKDLESNKDFYLNPQKITEKDKLISKLQKLKKRHEELEKEIFSLKTSETYQTINNITNWKKYFIETKTQLEQELKNLTIEMNN